MELWNGIWKKILVWNGIWNGRFMVCNRNGMEENCQYGTWKNRLPFHSIPCPDQNQNLFVGDKKHFQPIKTKFVVAKIAYFRMLRILKKQT